ncbi:c-type cytochrome [Pseudomonas nitroreducens]|uniref:cytochrome c n=1 Tax=Pseudomonas TaxID=286 RepID=UPI0002EC8AAE|nr:cytochrome c [Pseudomonas nitroreducens]
MKGPLVLLLLIAANLAQAETDSRAEPVRRGAYLARAADCVACHTAPDGKPFAGGLTMQTPIGAIYSTNITPDRDTGIGDYSFEDFDQAVRHGVGKRSGSLYPAMPFPSYARITDDDMQALYAYFMQGVPAVKQANRDSEIPWPLSMRWPLAMWRWMFAPEVADFRPGDSQDDVKARGAYLVEVLGHCGACHTPRAITLQEKALDARGEAFLAGGAPLEGWVAGNLRSDNRHGLGSWSEDELVAFLRSGRNQRTAVFGGMTEVIRHSTQHLSESDLRAIARYLAALPPREPNLGPYQYDDAVAKALWKGDDSQPGAAAYIDNCAACHRTDGQGYKNAFPALAGNPVLQDADATSVVNIILRGSKLPGMQHAPSSLTMPPFGWRLDDQQVADLTNFVRNSWGNGAPPIDADAVRKVRREPASGHIVSPVGIIP